MPDLASPTTLAFFLGRKMGILRPSTLATGPDIPSLPTNLPGTGTEKSARDELLRESGG